MTDKINDILSRLTLKQKVNLLYGKKFWYVEGKDVDGELENIMFADSPHGLRKQESKGDMLGVNESVPATVFPTGSASACSWDAELMREMGEALGQECISQNVDVLLGPAVNHKRDPRCGRNFEYFSEDPYLTGKLGAAYVNGLQSTGVGACVKHFAANSRENGRMYSDSIVDERTLREIYLKQFEIIVKESNPYCIMTAYNKLNGTYCTENKKLLTDIARNEWGFDGVFLTDWGAMSNQVESYKAGLDLEMPGTFGSDEDLVHAVESGELSENIINEHVARIINLIFKTRDKKPDVKFCIEDNVKLAQKIAEQSAVLLKNESLLPIKKHSSVAVIGAFAKDMRYQGNGSGRLNPVSVDCPFDELKKIYEVCYSAGYDVNTSVPDENLIRAAVTTAKKSEYAVIFAGLPNDSESEGYDRKSINMPESHIKLIEAVSKVNKNTVVVLQCGSPVSMPWINNVRAVLLMYLSGCRGGAACVNLLSGAVNPSGKLAETFPTCLDDIPDVSDFNKKEHYAAYLESLYTGYRGYEKAKIKPLFPFGHGLSYTRFFYDNVKAYAVCDKVTVNLTVKNSGNVDGREVVQIYVESNGYKQLKAFKKVFLKAGESKELEFLLDGDAFSHYSVSKNKWLINNGEYDILIGSSSQDIRLYTTVNIKTDSFETDNSFIAETEHQFFESLNLSTPSERVILPITVDSPIKDLKYTVMGKAILDNMLIAMDGQDEMIKAVSIAMPIRGMAMGKPMTRQAIADFINMLNKKTD